MTADENVDASNGHTERPEDASGKDSATAASGPSILAIMLDFDVWDMARSWAYANSYAVIDGLQACKCKVVVLPSLKTRQPNRNPWVDARKAVLEGETFDQVWIWITHSYYEPGFWRWLETVAPVRVGVLMESLVYEARDVAEAPILANRKSDVFAQLRSITHVVTADDTESAMIANETGKPTRAYLPMLPRSFKTPISRDHNGVAVFLGLIYGKRREFLERNATAESLLRAMIPPEHGTDIPQTFNHVTNACLSALQENGGNARLATLYVTSIKEIRRNVVRRTIASYNTSLAGVALPAMFKGVTGRVVEMMAASIPALLPHNPSSDQSLPQPLVNEENVLCYNPDRPGDLERQIRRLADEDGLRHRIASGAEETFTHELCAEVQMRRLLSWIAMCPIANAGSHS